MTDLPKVFEFPEGEWDGDWWAETLQGDPRHQYETLVHGLMVADHEMIPQLAREIFQIGRYMGWSDGLEAASK